MGFRVHGPLQRLQGKSSLSRFFERPGLNYGHLINFKCPEILSFSLGPRKVDIRLHGKGDSNSHGARPVH